MSTLGWNRRRGRHARAERRASTSRPGSPARGRGEAVAERPRILVVEDDPDIRTVMADALGAAGYAVDVAGDGAEGLAALRHATYALVILDLMMPQVDGLDLLRQGTAGGASLPPVLVVSAAPPEGLLAAKALGAAYLRKPFDLDVLLSMVARLTHADDEVRLEGARAAAWTMQHHLGNSLSVTLGHAELLADDPRLPDDLRWQAERAAEGVRRASERLQQLRRLDTYDARDDGSERPLLQVEPGSP